MNAPVGFECFDAKRQLPRWFGDYRLFERLGRGACGDVYRARRMDAAPDRALKVMLRGVDGRAARATFANERAMQFLRHPSLVPIVHAGTHDDRPFLAFPFIRGTSLRGLLRLGPLPPALAALVVTDVAAALHHAHTAQHGFGVGVVHRDVSPANILIGTDGSVRLIDFGVATWVGAEQPAVVGRPRYAPVEQLGCEAVAPAHDVYALGAVLFEALVGRLPFPQTATYLELLAQKASGPLMHDALPPRLAELVARCTHPSAPGRPSAWEVANALNTGAALGSPPRQLLGRLASRTPPAVAAEDDATTVRAIGGGAFHGSGIACPRSDATLRSRSNDSAHDTLRSAGSSE